MENHRCLRESQANQLPQAIPPFASLPFSLFISMRSSSLAVRAPGVPCSPGCIPLRSLGALTGQDLDWIPASTSESGAKFRLTFGLGQWLIALELEVPRGRCWSW